MGEDEVTPLPIRTRHTRAAQGTRPTTITNVLLVLLQVLIFTAFLQVFDSCCVSSVLVLGNGHIHSKFTTYRSNSNSTSVYAFVSVDKQLNKAWPKDCVASCKIFHKQHVLLHVRRCSFNGLTYQHPRHAFCTQLYAIWARSVKSSVV